MISLEGLTLVTGRAAQARGILHTLAHHVRDGLIPNLFPEGESEGLYHTADATLWFFHALQRYLDYTHDTLTLSLLYPTLKSIVDAHVRGTRFGIHVDERDGLLAQGAHGYQLTWMDAKVDDWVVTPRRGKAVEINALWYNALRFMQEWAPDHGDAGEPYRARADRARESFNRRFWFVDGDYLYDVVDDQDAGGRSDPKFRPNQIFAISLDHPVLEQNRWSTVMHAVYERLVTPVGLRSLAPDDPAYRPQHHGTPAERDRAYHQGTVWPWLIGPYVDACRRVGVSTDGLLDGLAAHVGEWGLGSVSETADGAAPHGATGCAFQAWSVAELLRVLRA
jgi:predicted glycogen debranching enzyme